MLKFEASARCFDISHNFIAWTVVDHMRVTKIMIRLADPAIAMERVVRGVWTLVGTFVMRFGRGRRSLCVQLMIFQNGYTAMLVSLGSNGSDRRLVIDTASPER
jgi:hypothetical protein